MTSFPVFPFRKTLQHVDGYRFSWLRAAILSLLVCLPCFEPHLLLSAQIVEDFACSVPASISNSRPAIVTCSEPHGFNQRAFTAVTFTANAASGDRKSVV